MSFDFSAFDPLVENALKCLRDRAKEHGELVIDIAEKVAQDGDPDEIAWATIVMDLERRTAGLDPRQYVQALHCNIAWLAMQIVEMRQNQD